MGARGAWSNKWLKHNSCHEGHRPVGCLFLPEGGLLFLPPMIPGSQHGGKADLGDLCSGVVSTELRLCPETHTYRGKQNYMNKSLLSKRALVNLSLWRTFLVPTGTTYGVREPDSLCEGLTLSFRKQLENPYNSLPYLWESSHCCSPWQFFRNPHPNPSPSRPGS